MKKRKRTRQQRILALMNKAERRREDAFGKRARKSKIKAHRDRQLRALSDKLYSALQQR